MFADQALASLRIETPNSCCHPDVAMDQALASLRIETMALEVILLLFVDQALASLRIETPNVDISPGSAPGSGSREPAD